MTNRVETKKPFLVLTSESSKEIENLLSEYCGPGGEYEIAGQLNHSIQENSFRNETVHRFSILVKLKTFEDQPKNREKEAPSIWFQLKKRIFKEFVFKDPQQDNQLMIAARCAVLGPFFGKTVVVPWQGGLYGSLRSLFEEIAPFSSGEEYEPFKILPARDSADCNRFCLLKSNQVAVCWLHIIKEEDLNRH